MIHYATLLIGAVLVLFPLVMTQTFVLPLAAIVLGFLFMGYAFPELLENLTPYSKTVWMPLGFVLAAIVAIYLVFGASTFQVLMGAQWCSIAPCIPIGLCIGSFVVGAFAKLGTLQLIGEKLDLFGEKIKD
jgi:hypothetical protein